MSLAFKQQNKLTVKIGLSAFISLGSKLLLTSFFFFLKTHVYRFLQVSLEMNQFFLGTFFPQGPSSLKAIQKFIKITVWFKG